MNRHFNEHAARQAELAVRLLALLFGALGGPCCAIAAVAMGRPLLGLGSIAASGPLAVVRMVPPPDGRSTRLADSAGTCNSAATGGQSTLGLVSNPDRIDGAGVGRAVEAGLVLTSGVRP